MDAVETEVLEIFTRTGALLKGHFVLRSGRHSGHFFQCARVCEDLGAVTRLASLLLPKLRDFEYQTVLAPAMGGLVIGQEVARQSGARFLFAEKVDDKLALRRGFRLRAGERVLVVEDVVTRGGRAHECLKLIRENGGLAIGIAMLVDRSEGQAYFDVPTAALLKMSFPTYASDEIPESLARLPAEKPGS